MLTGIEKQKIEDDIEKIHLRIMAVNKQKSYFGRSLTVSRLARRRDRLYDLLYEDKKAAEYLELTGFLQRG